MGRLTGGLACARLLTLIINVIFILLGLTIVGLGAYALKTGAVSTLKSFSLPWGLIVLGVFVVFLSFFGCMGAQRESRSLLQVYWAFLLFFVLAQITVGVLAYEYQDKVEDVFSSSWDQASPSERETIERDLHCCGYRTTSDRPEGPQCVPVPNFPTPCYEAIQDEMHKYIKIVIAGSAVVAFFELLGLAFAMTLICHIPTKAEREAEMITEARRLNRDFNHDRQGGYEAVPVV